MTTEREEKQCPICGAPERGCNCIKEIEKKALMQIWSLVKSQIMKN